MIYCICQGSLLGEQGPPQKSNCWQVKQKLEWERDNRHQGREIVDQELSAEYCLFLNTEKATTAAKWLRFEKLP